MSLPEDPQLNEQFRSAVVAAHAAGMSESDLAHCFGASKVTIRRWITGENHPHPAIMRFMIPQLNEEALKRARG